MPKYLLEVSYTPEGAKGVLKEGGTKRRDVARAAMASVGGTLESMYFAFGDCDVVCIAEGMIGTEGMEIHVYAGVHDMGA